MQKSSIYLSMRLSRRQNSCLHICIGQSASELMHFSNKEKGKIVRYISSEIVRLIDHPTPRPKKRKRPLEVGSLCNVLVFYVCRPKGDRVKLK